MWERAESKVTALIIDPDDDRILYAAFGRSGIFRSSDSGRTWTRSSNGLENDERRIGRDGVDVNQLVAVGSRPPHLLAATSSGLFASVDRGERWARLPVPLPPHAGVNCVAPDPGRGGLIFVGTAYGIVRSTDDGATWVVLDVNSDAREYGGHPFVSALVMDPRNPEHVFAFAAGRVIRSLDGGSSWLPTARFEVDATACQSLLFDPKTSALYAGTDQGVFKSVDDGNGWGWIRTGPRQVHSIAVLGPAGYVLVGANSLTFRSRDDGLSWEWFGPPLTKQWAIVSLAPSRTDPLHDFAGSSRGVIETRDGGETWSSTADNSAQVLSIAVERRQPGGIWLGTDRGGVLHSLDQGRTWTSTGLRSETTTTLLVLKNAQNQVLAGTNWNGIFRSVDGGKTWEPSSSGLTSRVSCPMNSCPIDITAMAANESVRPVIFSYVYGGGLFRSDDQGQTWTSTGYNVSQWLKATGLAVDPKNGRHLLIGTEDGGLLRSVDAGKTATPVFLSQGVVQRGPVEVGHGGDAFYAAVEGRLFRSRDGARWQLVSSDLTTPGVDSAAEYSPAGPPSQRLEGCKKATLAVDNRGEAVYLSCDAVLWYRPRPSSSFLQAEPFPPAPPLGADSRFSDEETSITALVADGGCIIAANGYGLFRSADRGRTWQVILPFCLAKVTQ